MTIDRQVLQQRINELAGVRRQGANLGRAAVRLDDVEALFRISEAPASAKASGGSVTTTEFDALVEDVHAIHTILRAMKVALRARRGR